jgi:hypothetical protein
MTAFLLVGVTPGGVYTFRYKQSSLSIGESASGFSKYCIFSSREASPSVPTNCCMHEGLNACAWSGDGHAGAGWGGEKRSGGDCAKGMPRYAFAAAAIVGWFEGLMVVPMRMPEAIVTEGAATRASTGDSEVGAQNACGVKEHSERS